jgi:Fic family protein
MIKIHERSLMNKIPVGYKAISERLRLQTLPHYRESYIALRGRGKVIIDGYHETHIYPKTYALKNEHDLLENLEFALKHDGINLEIINALFEQIEKHNVTAYIQDQPTRIYPRKIWYLYEFLMNEQLPLENCKKIKHVDLVDPTLYFTSMSVKSSRHAINDNLLGSKQFCPIIRRTQKIEKYVNSNLDSQAKSLLEKYDSRLIARACNYLYTKETMSSYQIEKEQPDKTRLARFITLLQQAHIIKSLSKNKLIELQNVIVDARFADVDYRHTQNYVGENINPYYQKIHYISPKPEDVPELMQGLLNSLNKMLRDDVHPVIVAAAISFGFVFIHPFEDGNGRIHRFLIHYILSKKEFTPKDIIFPISSVILKNMHAYDQTLELFSKPLLDILTRYDLTDEGIMTVNQASKSYYQYLDFTEMVEYLFFCIEDAVNNHLERELMFLENYDTTKVAIQEMIDMPDNQIDLLIKFILQNKGVLSENKRSQFFPLLKDKEIEQITLIINNTMTKESA